MKAYLLFPSQKLFFLNFYLYALMFSLHMCLYEESQDPGTGDTDTCELPYVC